MFKKLARFGAIAGLAMSIAPLIAVLPAAAEVYRNPQNSVFVTGLQPQQRVTMTYSGVMRNRDFQADSCGRIVMRNSATSPIPASIVVAGETVDTASLPTQILPRCTNGVAEEMRSANFRTTSGDVVIVGRAPSSYTTVQTPTERTRNATANACGFAMFSNSTSFQHSPSTIVSIPGQPVTNDEISSLTQRDSPLCSRGQMFVPLSWLNNN